MDNNALYNTYINVNYKNYENNSNNTSLNIVEKNGYNDISGNVNDLENDTISDTKYRENILDVFCLSKEEYDSIYMKVDYLYNYIKSNQNTFFTESEFKEFNNILEKCASKFFSEDKGLGMMVLFSYDYFYITHKLICDILLRKKSNKNLKDLVNLICN